MADTRFFKNSGPFTVAELVKITGAVLTAPAMDLKIVEDVAALDIADEHHVSFIDNVKYREQFKATKAGVCFVSPEMADFAPVGTVCLVTKSPYKAYALAAQAFYPDEMKGSGSISPHAVIHETAQIGKNVTIDACAVIGPSVIIGDNSRIGSNASISHAVIGQNVRIYPGARIGQDGFGFAIDPTGHVKVPQLGRVIIGDNVEIGANSCIDRGAGPDTVIGNGTWIDNLVQIGHNVRIGRGCVIVSQVGISGSTVLEDFVVLAGQVGVAGHLRIGMGARVAAQSGIMRNIEPKSEYMGYPAVPIKSFLRQTAILARLVNKK
jgi:UDP-3-O-[3-hydroxymyristoyl] glucosamine N-acyltransferase